MRAAAAVCLLALFALAASSTPPSDIRFMAMGDWGGQTEAPYTTEGQLQVAAQMTKTSSEFGSQFVLALGDNFYSYGVANVDSPRFKATFEDVYNSTELENQPWYVVAGNHDHRQNVSAEIAYSQRSTRWTYPSPYYSFLKTMQNGSRTATVQFVMIDTVQLVAGDKDQYYFIKQTLAQSTADWIIVAGHYPVYSVAEHGTTDTMVQYIKPLMVEAGVAAYLAGHDHNLQALLVNETEPAYVQCGAAHGLEFSMAHESTVPKDSLKFFFPDSADIPADAPQGGFVTVRIGMDSLTVTYLDSFGHELFTVNKANPRKSL